MTTITTRELLQGFPKLQKGLAKGTRYSITNHGKPVAELIPPTNETLKPPHEKILKRGELLEAFRKIQFKSDDPLLSQKVDTYLYGAPYDPTRY